MNYSLENLKKPKANKRKKKRVGRGKGSGKGTYSGRGIKGQRSRSGGRKHTKRRAAFQQLLIRTPKERGFKRQSPVIQIVNLSDLDKNFAVGDKVDLRQMAKKGLIDRQTGLVKILAGGKLGKSLTVTAHYFSKTASAAITKAGGSFEVIGKK